MSYDIEREMPSVDDLERLLVNNQALGRIEAFLSRFNPIRVMRIERKELLHSAILSWLMDPRETHGLGDKFLRAFLGEALRGHASQGTPTALDVSQADLRDTEVRREWENMDIVLRSPENHWAFVIENKFDSSQGKDQLSRYMEKIHALFESDGDDLNVRGIFLTLHDEVPQDERYAPIGYDAVCDILFRISDGGLISSNEVAVFIGHYIEILKETLGVSEEHNEMERLARELYRTNRKALDFVVQYGQETDFEMAVRSLIGEHEDFDEPVKIDGYDYHFDEIGNDAVSFVPREWYVALGDNRFTWDGCDNWWIEWPLSARFEISSSVDGPGGQIRLIGEVGPLANHKFRKELIEAIQNAAKSCGSKRIQFQKGAADQGRRYSRFFKKANVSVDDVQEPEEISAAIRKLLEQFRKEFEAIGKVLKPFQQYGEEE